MKDLEAQIKIYRYILAEILGYDEDDIDSLIEKLGADGVVEKHNEAQDDRIYWATLTVSV